MKIRAVARILIIEPDEEVRGLISWVVRRLELEPLEYDRFGDVPDVAAVLVEPAAAGAIEAARAVREATGAGVVCVSIQPPDAETAVLEPVAHLLKPFPLLELERALLSALASGTPVAAA